MNNKNILLVISKFPPEYSGPGVRIPRLYKWFEEKNYNLNLNVICNGIEQIKNEEYIFEGLTVRRITAEFLNKIFLKLSFLPKRLTHAIIYQYEFIKTLLILFLAKKYKNTDFLHVAGHSGGTVAALLWARLGNIPVLMELVTEHARHKQKYLFFFEVKIPDNGMIVALTQKTKKDCINLGLNEDKIWCRPNPIDQHKFYPEFDRKYELKKLLTPFKNDKKVISNVAKMMPQKNQLLIVSALQFLPSEYVAVLAGPFIKEGPLYGRDLEYMDTIKKNIKEYNLHDRVHLVPDFVEAENYMKLADVYVMPAWNEGFGTPMMEAMACGIPVVANNAETAFQEWIVGGKNGYLCDINNPEEWAQAIEEALKFSQDKCLKISSQIHKKAGQEVIYNHYESIIQTLLNDK